MLRLPYGDAGEQRPLPDLPAPDPSGAGQLYRTPYRRSRSNGLPVDLPPYESSVRRSSPEWRPASVYLPVAERPEAPAGSTPAPARYRLPTPGPRREWAS